jgi:1-phosphofructokinase
MQCVVLGGVDKLFRRVSTNRGLEQKGFFFLRGSGEVNPDFFLSALKRISFYGTLLIEKEPLLKMNAGKITTVGLTPVWDRTCYVDGIEWGDHKVIASQTREPAGKALNISKALAWLSVPSMAAGLWGAADYADMTEAMSEFQEYIETAYTVVKGQTRQNVTVVDTRKNRELHLRSSETLITRDSISLLSRDLQGRLDPQGGVIFAGSIPEGMLQDECVALIKQAGRQCAELIVDTSGSALAKIVNQGGLGVIKPNIEELSSLLGRSVDKDIEKVVLAAGQLCDRVRVVIVSLGRQGAVAVTKETSVYCRIKNGRHPVVHTVGCGDYLLAGYVSVSNTADIGQKLSTGVKAATAKAWGWVGVKPWRDVQNNIEVEMTVR